MFISQPTYDDARKAGLTQCATPTEAARCATDYLREIYRHVKKTYEEITGTRDWASSSVSFLFSTPTIWKDTDVIHTFQTVIRHAGFGTEGPQHSAQVDLTEAEATIVDTFKSRVVNFRAGDIFLTLDAGGTTTDFSLLQVVSVDHEIPQMSQISETSSVGVGSTLIDAAFGDLVEQRLAANPDVPIYISDGLAQRMMKSERFRCAKHLFGDPSSIAQVHRIVMPGVPTEFSHGGLRAERGCMLFDK
ncbi:hypothetical protein ACHAPT_006862 [Fusarium lateritium]